MASTSVIACATAFMLLQVTACGDEDNAPAVAPGKPDARARGAPVHPDASCEVEIASPEYQPASHVDVGTEISYNSNPPSSGNHYPDWAGYDEYTKPVPRPFYVHNLEHGAIVLLHRCANDDEGCSDIVAGLRAAAATLPDDSRCREGGPKKRIIISPDPLLDVPVAAAAWGWTYRAQCVDAPTLEQFIRENYARGPEDTCTNGSAKF